MSHTTTEYRLEGDNSIYAQADGKVVPVVTRAGAEDTNTAQSGDCIRVSGVSIQHTPPQPRSGSARCPTPPPATAHFRTTTVRQRPVATCSAATAGSTSARTTQSSST